MMTDEDSPDISVTDIHIKILPFSWKTELINKSHLLFFNTALDNLLTQSLSHIPCANQGLNQNTTVGNRFQSHLPWAWSDATQSHEVMPHNHMTENCHQNVPNVVCFTSLSGFQDFIILTDV
jgi:hypothetical protein